MCGLAVGILYARSSDRALHVDWRDRAFGSQQDNLFPQLLRVLDLPTTDTLPTSTSVLPEIWNGRLDLSLDELRSLDLEQRGITWSGDAPAWDRDDAIRRYSIDVTRFDLAEDVVVIWSGASMNELVTAQQRLGMIDSSMTADQMLGDVIRSSVRFVDEIEDRVADFRSGRFAERSVLGVHYRKTNEAAAARSLPTEKQYVRATDRALDQMPDDAVIFLATDNVMVQSLYQQRYGKNRIYWTEKWLPADGRSIHKNSDCPDGSLAAKDALMDVGLLASCDRLVLTGNSSFSSLAAWFARCPTSDRDLVFPESGSVPRRILRFLKRLAIQ
ncbi:hypothetical protein NZK35_22480 [Stieleria sp. ICT_E10.1]|uniref:hypothetical protein n=1 Tax=Stieleria sedimenti TaxID=2976331 RepID=UPI0021807EB6|nr:hypothetical protein [Stieleria sedimenti]MCS7469429.1 hypothetical protein [Stieleria sedimenti]